MPYCNAVGKCLYSRPQKAFEGKEYNKCRNIQGNPGGKPDAVCSMFSSKTINPSVQTKLHSNGFKTTVLMS